MSDALLTVALIGMGAGLMLNMITLSPWLFRHVEQMYLGNQATARQIARWIRTRLERFDHE